MHFGLPLVWLNLGFLPTDWWLCSPSIPRRIVRLLERVYRFRAACKLDTKKYPTLLGLAYYLTQVPNISRGGSMGEISLFRPPKRILYFAAMKNPILLLFSQVLAWAQSGFNPPLKYIHTSSSWHYYFLPANRISGAVIHVHRTKFIPGPQETPTYCGSYSFRTRPVGMR